MSTTDNFFGQQQEKSKIKTLIVTDFFKAYFPIINNSVGKESNEIIYLDLFCGPGKFDDGANSTPLALLDLINNFKNDEIRNKLRIVFNDENEDFVELLNENISSHEVLGRLKFKPTIMNKRAGEVDIKLFTNKEVPIFSFIDPWGYKDVSAKHVWDLVKNVGSDCVLFFNSNRCLMDIPKESQSCHFQMIFGDQLSNVVNVVNSPLYGQKIKTQKIVELFSRNLYEVMSKENYPHYRLYVLPFAFEADDKEKVSHHIVFISKSHKAVLEMKKVMVKHCNVNSDCLGFDSKDQLQISLFNRADYIDNSIVEIVKTYFLNKPKSFNHTWTIASLLEVLDRYNMEKHYQVTPYTFEELKGTIENMCNKGKITLIIENGKKIKKNITDSRKFKVNQELLV
jgi:three-Cys-motif partner protein